MCVFPIALQRSDNHLISQDDFNAVWILKLLLWLLMVNKSTSGKPIERDLEITKCSFAITAF